MRYPLNKTKLLNILELSNLSIRGLEKEPDFHWTARTIRRAFKNGASYELITDLAKYLGVNIGDIS
jgi:hypothetical protein